MRIEKETIKLGWFFLPNNVQNIYIGFLQIYHARIFFKLKILFKLFTNGCVIIIFDTDVLCKSCNNLNLWYSQKIFRLK